MYDRPVARQEQVYAGELSIDGAAGEYGEVWHAGDAAVVYSRDGHIIGPMREAVIDTTTYGKLVVTGKVDGQPATWEAVTPERILASFRDTEVTLADGTTIKGLVTATNHRVMVENGSRKVELGGARVKTLGGRSARIEAPGGKQMPMLLPKRGCGCGGAGTTA